jgi:hypothetical protein
MRDQFSQQVGQLNRRMEELRELAGEIDASRPQQVQAGDASGTITVVLGPDGFPESARVGPDWRREVGPDKFGSAVAEACQAAQQGRMANWTRALEDGGLIDLLGRIDAAATRDIETLQVASDRWTPAAQVDNRVPQLPEHLVFAAVDAIEELDIESTVSGRGSGFAARGKLAVDFCATGTVTCVADPDWVARQNADELTDALGRAFDTARADLAANEFRLPPALNELMSMISDPWR